MRKQFVDNIQATVLTYQSICIVCIRYRLFDTVLTFFKINLSTPRTCRMRSVVVHIVSLAFDLTLIKNSVEAIVLQFTCGSVLPLGEVFREIFNRHPNLKVDLSISQSYNLSLVVKILVQQKFCTLTISYRIVS